MGTCLPHPTFKLAVPIGFESMLESFAKEVLREQPENVFQFGANYFHDLLLRRDRQEVDG